MIKELAREGFYDGTPFHRVSDGFMAQGGGMLPGMKQKTTRDPIKNESIGGLPNKRGTISMAMTPAMPSGLVGDSVSKEKIRPPAEPSRKNV